MNQQPPMYNTEAGYYQGQPYPPQGQPYATQGQPYAQGFYGQTNPSSVPYPPYSPSYPPNEDTPISFGQSNKPSEPTLVDGEKFPTERSFRDVVFLFLFLLHLAGFIALASTSVSYARHHTHEPPSSNSTVSGDQFHAERVSNVSLMTTTGVSILTAICFSYFWLNLIRKYPKPLTYLSIAASIGFLAIMTISFFTIQQVGLGIFFGVILILELFFVYLCRSRIEFAANTLACVGKLITQFHNTQWIALSSLIPLSLYCIVWIATVRAILIRADDDQNSHSAFLLLFCCFSLYWTTQVLKGVVHVTCAGVFSTWYYLAERMPSHPTWHAFRRAVTTSFGSICFGGLLVALIKTIRVFFSMLRGDDEYGFLAIIVDCFLSMIDSLVQYFNRYAFVQVAVYGKTFCQAAKSTWDLFKLHGFEAIINDDFTGAVLSLGVIIGGVVTAMIGGLFGAIFTGIHQEQMPSVMFACFFIGLVLVLTTMEVIDSGVATIFVCFVEQPDRLKSIDPEFYVKFKESYGNNMGLFSDV